MVSSNLWCFSVVFAVCALTLCSAATLPNNCPGLKPCQKGYICDPITSEGCTKCSCIPACPPIPNCQLGYSCRVEQHPHDCPICKCVPCPDAPCIPERGQLCTSEMGNDGCGSCNCGPCPEERCESGCNLVEPLIGCPLCDCPEKRIAEMESNIFNATLPFDSAFDP